jgi:hypothetical protein
MQGICNSHAGDIGGKGMMSHNGSDGQDPFQRINSTGVAHNTAAENIYAGGKDSTAQDIIISLVIDDGVSSRGHRSNIFNAALTGATCGIEDHTSYGLVAVFDYIGGGESGSDSGAFKAAVAEISEAPAGNSGGMGGGSWGGDGEMPPGCVGMSQSSSSSTSGGKTTTVTTTEYTMGDGST